MMPRKPWRAAELLVLLWIAVCTIAILVILVGNIRLLSERPLDAPPALPVTLTRAALFTIPR